MTGQADGDGNRLTSNPETSGRYHSSWLSMMYPRLFLARQLLRDDGVIFISIDDHEVHHLRMLMNEVFGEENFLCPVVWRRRQVSDNRNKTNVSIDHEYVVAYSRHASIFNGNAKDLTSFRPLVEETVETMSSSFANHVTKAARDVVLVGQPAGKTSHDLLISGHGIGGTAYVGLKKGTAAYANGLAQAQAGHDLALAAGKTHVVRAVTNVHGESDSNLANAAYEANLLEWQSNYETDVTAITRQVEAIPMLHTQFSSWTRLTGLPATSIIPGAQLAAHENAPGKIVLVGAKYHLPYVADGVHLTNEGYRHMGEDYAKVYRRVILEGQPWEPVRPKTVTRAGAVVTVKMHVPAPPLVLDTTIVSNPGNFGFEWSDGGPTPTIVSVALSGPDTVVITLSAAPSGASPRLRYAFTGTSGARGGPTTGPRGNLRDSDKTPSRSGYELYNWCVHFDVPAP